MRRLPQSFTPYLINGHTINVEELEWLSEM